MAAFHLPNRTCDHMHLIEALHDADLAEAKDSEIKLVFQSRTSFTSGALAMLCAWGLLRRSQGCHFVLSPSARQADISYPSRMDLFHHLGINHHETFQRHDPAGRFQPLLTVGKDASPMNEAVEKLLDVVRNRFARSEQFLPALSWIVQELIDNIANHAQSPVPGVVCAQYYPSRQRLDLAIWDTGLGLKKTLATRYPIIFSHGDAISKSLEGDITRDPDAFQGNGLSGAHEIVNANRGEMHIWTGNATYSLLADKKPSFKLTQQNRDLPGTGVLLRLNTDHPIDLTTTSLTRGTRLMRRSAAQQAVAGGVINLADFDHRGGRAAARSLRETLIPRFQTEETVRVNFNGVLMPAHSFLDELFGKTAQHMGLVQYFRNVVLENCPDRICGSIDQVLGKRFGEEEALAALPAEETTPHLAGEGEAANPDQEYLSLARKNLKHLCDPRTIFLCDGGSELVSPAWLNNTWPQAQLLTGPLPTPDLMAAWLADLANNKGAILLVPPIQALSVAQKQRFHITTSSTPAHVLGLLLQQSDPGQFTLLVAPESLDDQTQYFRTHIWEPDKIRMMMELTTQPFGRGAAASITLVGLGPRRERETAHEIALFNGETLLKNKLGHAELRRISAIQQPFANLSNQWGFRHVWDLDEVPCFALHHPTRREREALLETRLEMVELQSLLADMYSGPQLQEVETPSLHSARVLGENHLRAERLDPDLLSVGISPGHTSLAAAEPEPLGPSQKKQPEENRDRHEPGNPESEAVIPDPLARFRLQVNDLVLPIIFRTSTVPLLVTQRLLGCVPDPTCMVLRLLDPSKAPVLAELLQTPLVRGILGCKPPASVVILNDESLKLKKVPRPESDLIQGITHLGRTSQRLSQLIAELNQARRSMLSLDTFDQSWGQLMLKAEVVEDTVASFSDVGRQYQRFYPLPLAFAWRKLSVLHSPTEKYPQIINAIERTLAFMSCYLIADLKKGNAQVHALLSILAKMSGHGATAGEWFALLCDCPQNREAVIPELNRLLRDKKGIWKKDLIEYLGMRNDLAHARGPSTLPHFKLLNKKAESILEGLYAKLTFLLDYPLIQIDACHYDSLRRVHIIRYRNLTGDHNIIKTREREVPTHVAEGLHFQAPDKRYHLISPWLVFRECDDCGQWEVAHPEREAKGKGMLYKGIWSGHMSRPVAGIMERLKLFVGVDDENV